MSQGKKRVQEREAIAGPHVGDKVYIQRTSFLSPSPETEEYRLVVHLHSLAAACSNQSHSRWVLSRLSSPKLPLEARGTDPLRAAPHQQHVSASQGFVLGGTIARGSLEAEERASSGVVRLAGKAGAVSAESSLEASETASKFMQCKVLKLWNKVSLLKEKDGFFISANER